MLNVFRRRGWRDSGAALAIVRALENANGELSVRAASMHTPDDFLVRNALKRRDVEDALRELSGSSAACRNEAEASPPGDR